MPPASRTTTTLTKRTANNRDILNTILSIINSHPNDAKNILNKEVRLIKQDEAPILDILKQYTDPHTTLLHIAARMPSHPLNIEKIMEYIETDPSPKQDSDGNTIFHIACLHRSYDDIVKLASKFEPTIWTVINVAKQTPLHIVFNRIDRVIDLQKIMNLEGSLVAINIKDREDHTPFRLLDADMKQYLIIEINKRAINLHLSIRSKYIPSEVIEKIRLMASLQRPQQGGYTLYQGKSHKIQTGQRGGKFIVVGSEHKKVYVK